MSIEGDDGVTYSNGHTKQPVSQSGLLGEGTVSDVQHKGDADVRHALRQDDDSRNSARSFPMLNGFETCIHTTVLYFFVFVFRRQKGFWEPGNMSEPH